MRTGCGGCRRRSGNVGGHGAGRLLRDAKHRWSRLRRLRRRLSESSVGQSEQALRVVFARTRRRSRGRTNRLYCSLNLGIRPRWVGGSSSDLLASPLDQRCRSTIGEIAAQPFILLNPFEQTL
jgi:hypothetical protein